jgi:hypothetical protein
MEDEIPEWARRCPSGKIKFASAADARKAYRHGGHKRSLSGVTGSIRSYRCPECDSFHVSSKGRTNR